MAFARSSEQLCTRGLGDPEVARLRKEVREYKQLADTYREQRDKLQADWDAWDYGKHGLGADDNLSLYGTVQSEATFDPITRPTDDGLRKKGGT